MILDKSYFGFPAIIVRLRDKRTFPRSFFPRSISEHFLVSLKKDRRFIELGRPVIKVRTFMIRG